jgi:hypothetical protein
LLQVLFCLSGFSQITIPDHTYTNQTSKQKRSVHWDSSQQLSKKYPVIKWDSVEPVLDKDEDEKELKYEEKYLLPVLKN